MTAKEARDYAKKRLSIVEGENKELFQAILDEITHNIELDPTRTFISISVPPRQIIAWLESPGYGYETKIVQCGPAESELKISWSEDSMKMY